MAVSAHTIRQRVAAALAAQLDSTEWREASQVEPGAHPGGQFRFYYVMTPQTRMIDRRRVRPDEDAVLARTIVQVDFYWHLDPRTPSTDMDTAMAEEGGVHAAVLTAVATGTSKAHLGDVDRQLVETERGLVLRIRSTFEVDHCMPLVSDIVIEPPPTNPPDPPTPDPGDWYVLQLDQAAQAYGAVAGDLATQDEDGWVDVSLRFAGALSNRYAHDATGAGTIPLQWRWTITDARGAPVAFPSEDWIGELRLELDTDALPDRAHRMAVRMGIADRVLPIAGAGQHRLVEYLHGATSSSAALYAPNSVSTHTIGDAARDVQTECRAWDTEVQAYMLDPATRVPTGTKLTGTRVYGGAAYWHLQVGTLATKSLLGVDDVGPIRFRPWVRVYRLVDPS